MYRLTKIAADGSDAAADATDHQVVRLERDILIAPLLITAQQSPALNWADANEWAESLTINGWRWRLPVFEEGVLIPDRSRETYPFTDPAFFPGCEDEWIWTSTKAPSGCAWFVYLGNGDSSRDGQSVRYHVRAVRAGQF